MTKAELLTEIKAKESFLCVGLDSDLERIPKHLLSEEDPIYEFNKAIIEATSDLAVAYKPNIAFYECLGEKGWETLRKTLALIPKNCFTIADAKRGDIGNTSRYYAKTFFEQYEFDSITVAPYMGSDSVKPFLEFPNKWTILLALTSNEGAKDFQFINSEGKQVFESVLETSSKWGSAENMMYVVGATKAEKLAEIRQIIPEHFLLVPGVGAQGGSLEEVAKYGMNSSCGLLVNSSRGIIYASDGEDFAEAARASAHKLQQSMSQLLKSHL
ncbi:MAG: orotidine-5'-phosphate decarboxylase [Flavobacteriales bacterium]